MSKYRVKLVPFGKSAVDERELDFASESDAVFQCHAMLSEYQSVELWDGDRLICQMTRPRSTQSRQK